MTREHNGETSQTLGTRGEELAAEHLREQGWSIRARNYEGAGGEIDIVAETTASLGDDEVPMIAFVEVKTRSRADIIAPESAVTREKRRTITRVADRYLEECETMRVSARFDVVTVILTDREAEIHHYPSAFDAEARLN